MFKSARACSLRPRACELRPRAQVFDTCANLALPRLSLASPRLIKYKLSAEVRHIGATIRNTMCRSVAVLSNKFLPSQLLPSSFSEQQKWLALLLYLNLVDAELQPTNAKASGMRPIKQMNHWYPTTQLVSCVKGLKVNVMRLFISNVLLQHRCVFNLLVIDLN